MIERAVAEELRRRAVQLATPPTPPGETDTTEVLTFRWDGATYAVATSHVRETVPDTALIVVPGARPPLLGAATVRSHALPVLDLRPLLGTGGPPRDVARLVVLEEGGRASLALAADDLLGLIALRASELHPSPARTPLARATTTTGALLVDADALLDLPPFFAAEGPHR